MRRRRRAATSPLLMLVVVLLALLAPVASPVSARASGPLEEVASFDSAAGELPEGIAIDRRGTIYVGLAPLGQIRRLTADGTQTVLATLPNGDGLLIGLAVDARGVVYAALASFDEATHGVWRVERGGASERLAALPANGLPNSLAFDRHGNLFVTDSILGAVWRIPPRGEAELWVADDLLLGDPNFQPFPVGANGLAFDRHGDLLVANSNFGRIVRIPVAANGGAGRPQTFLETPEIGNPDGIALDRRGNLYIASPIGDMIVRVRPDRSVETLAAGGEDGLDFPASLAFGTTRGQRKDLFITNFALADTSGANPIHPRPAVVKMAVGVPGRRMP